jgi:hypothetical protein
VAAEHRTDSLSSAVNNMSNREEFNRRYEGVMRYYGVKPQHTNPASPNENGRRVSSSLRHPAWEFSVYFPLSFGRSVPAY